MIGEIGMLRKTLVQTVSTLTLATSVLAHSQSERGTGMMWNDGGWMHSASEMMGYNMWGMGWYGLLFGIAIWTLVILGIIYLYQQITEEEQEG